MQNHWHGPELGPAPGLKTHWTVWGRSCTDVLVWMHLKEQCHQTERSLVLTRLFFNSFRSHWAAVALILLCHFSFLTYSPNTWRSFTAIQCPALGRRFYLNLLFSLNMWATFPSITPTSAIAVLPAYKYVTDSWSSFLWRCCCWVNFCIKQGYQAYLDYHCLLAQWMEVSISVTTAGFTETQTRNLKANLWLSLHQRSSQLLVMHCLVGFWKKTLQWFPHHEQHGAPNTDWKSNLEFWVFETVDSPSFHVCSHFDVSHEVDDVLCWKTENTVTFVLVLWMMGFSKKTECF